MNLPPTPPPCLIYHPKGLSFATCALICSRSPHLQHSTYVRASVLAVPFCHLMELRSHLCTSTVAAPSSNWQQNSRDSTGFTLTPELKMGNAARTAAAQIRSFFCLPPWDHVESQGECGSPGHTGAAPCSPSHLLQGGIHLRLHRRQGRRDTASPPQLCSSPGHERGHFPGRPDTSP